MKNMTKITFTVFVVLMAVVLSVGLYLNTGKDEGVSCQRCGSHRMMVIRTRCNDLDYCAEAEVCGIFFDGYVPKVRNVSNEEGVLMSVCLDCGQVQGEFPVPDPDSEGMYE